MANFKYSTKDQLDINPNQIEEKYLHQWLKDVGNLFRKYPVLSTLLKKTDSNWESNGNLIPKIMEYFGREDIRMYAYALYNDDGNTLLYDLILNYKESFEDVSKPTEFLHSSIDSYPFFHPYFLSVLKLIDTPRNKPTILLNGEFLGTQDLIQAYSSIEDFSIELHYLPLDNKIKEKVAHIVVRNNRPSVGSPDGAWWDILKSINKLTSESKTKPGRGFIIRDDKIEEVYTSSRMSEIGKNFIFNDKYILTALSKYKQVQSIYNKLL